MHWGIIAWGWMLPWFITVWGQRCKWCLEVFEAWNDALRALRHYHMRVDDALRSLRHYHVRVNESLMHYCMRVRVNDALRHYHMRTNDALRTLRHYHVRVNEALKHYCMRVRVNAELQMLAGEPSGFLHFGSTLCIHWTFNLLTESERTKSKSVSFCHK